MTNSLYVKADDEIYYEGESLHIELGQGGAHGGNQDYSSYSGLTILTECPDNNNENNNNYSLDNFLCQFNCHYFTFFSSVPTRHAAVMNNYYWLDDIGPFLGTLYVETNRYDAEIIVYYNGDNEIKHSGRVQEVYGGTSCGICGDADLVRVISKWEEGNVIIHNGICCPYAHFSGAYVKYYKYYNSFSSITYMSENQVHKKVFNFAYKSWFSELFVAHRDVINPNSFSDSVHYFTCEYGECNHSSSELHSLNYLHYDEEKHIKKCLSCNYQICEFHNWQQISNILFRCSDCGQTARFIPIIHNGINNSLFSHKNIIMVDSVYYIIELV